MYRESAGSTRPTQAQTIHFNALPEASRAQLAGHLKGEKKPGPALLEEAQVWRLMPLWVGAIVVGLGGLWLLLQTNGALPKPAEETPLGLASFEFFGMSEVEGPLQVQPEDFIAYYVACLLSLFVGVFQTVYALTLRSTLPYPPGRYVFSGFLLDARSAKIRVIPIHDVQDVGTAKSRVILRFAGTTESFRTENAFIAEEKAQDVRLAQKAQSTELPFPELESQDALFDLASQRSPARPSSGVVARTLPPALRFAVIALGLLAFPLGYSLWLMRNTQVDTLLFTNAEQHGTVEIYQSYLDNGGLRHEEVLTKIEEASYHEAATSIDALAKFIARYPTSTLAQKADEQMFALACEEDSADGYKTYLSVGKKHRSEAETHLSAAAFRTAARSRSLLALKKFMQENASSPFLADANLLYENIFHQELEKFNKTYSFSNSNLSNKILKLYHSFRETKNNKISIILTHPSTKDILTLDKSLVANDSNSIIDTFKAENSEYRTKNIISNLSTSLEGLFNNKMYFADEVSLDKKGTAPTLEISYSIKPSDSFIEEGDEKYSILKFMFNVEFSIPGDSDIFTFVYEVIPPEDFEFETSQIYSEMVSRAFNELYFMLRDQFLHRAVFEPSEQPWLYSSFTSENASYLVGDGVILEASNAQPWNIIKTDEIELYGIWGDNEQLYAVGQGAALSSTNKGQSFTTTSLEDEETNLNAIQGSPSGALWTVGSEGTILHSKAGLSSTNVWERQNTNTNQALNAVLVIDDQTVYAAGDHGTILYTKDAGTTWTAAKTNTTEDFNAIVAINKELFAVGEDGLIAHSTDGVNFELTHYGSSDLNGITKYKDNIFIVGDNQLILKSTDQGRTWREEFFGEGTIYTVFSYNNALYAAGEMGLLKRQENGQWEQEILPIPQHGD